VVREILSTLIVFVVGSLIVWYLLGGDINSNKRFSFAQTTANNLNQVVFDCGEDWDCFNEKLLFCEKKKQG